MYTPMRQALALGLSAVWLGTLPTAVHAQTVQATIPENATKDYYGTNWKYNKGYIKEGKKCVAFVLPENAFATDGIGGQGWRCKFGYRETKNACLIIEIPKNAYLGSSGYDWECERGYLKSNRTSCAQIVVPEHGYLNGKSYGIGWSCDYGYAVKGQACAKIVVPEGGYLTADSIESGWKCLREFRKSGDGCSRIVVPESQNPNTSLIALTFQMPTSHSITSSQRMSGTLSVPSLW